MRQKRRSDGATKRRRGFEVEARRHVETEARRHEGTKARRGGCAVAFAIILGLAASALAQNDWPMAAHDPARSGCGGQTLLPPYKEAWTRQFGAGPFPDRIGEGAQVVSVGNLAYVGTEHGELHAMKITDGTDAWMAKLPSVISGSACIANGIIIQGCEDGGIYAFDAASGKPAWQYLTDGGIWSAPCAAGGVVYVTSKDGNVYALDVASGALRWKAATTRPIYLSPAVANGRVFVGSEDMSAYAFDAASGKQLWRSEKLPGASFRDWWPVVVGDVVFLQSQPTHDASARGQSSFGEGYRSPLAAGQDPAQNKEAIRKAMVENILRDRLDRQICMALKVADGTEAYVPAVNLNGGADHVPHPLFLTPDGFIGGRNRRMELDGKGKYNRSQISFWDAKTGAFSDKPALNGGMQVADESSCYGGAAGWIVLLSQGVWVTAWDARSGKTLGNGGITGPGWHEGGAGTVANGQYYQSPFSAANGRLYLIYPGVVRCWAAGKVEAN